jgi:gluconate 2-dehydrogenase gamma chain
MATYNSDRRSVLKIIGAIGATCAYPFAGDELYAQSAHSQGSVPVASTRRYFNDNDFQMISRIADLIVPETDTPGAVGAGVPDYIDLLVARNTDHQSLVADGLRWLDSESERVASRKFLALDEAQQLSLLEPLCEKAERASNDKETSPRNVEFFRVIKSLTADGYYTSKVGLMEELGYKGNMVMKSFPDCVHEH